MTRESIETLLYLLGKVSVPVMSDTADTEYYRLAKAREELKAELKKLEEMPHD